MNILNWLDLHIADGIMWGNSKAVAMLLMTYLLVWLWGYTSGWRKEKKQNQLIYDLAETLHSTTITTDSKVRIAKAFIEDYYG